MKARGWLRNDPSTTAGLALILFFMAITLSSTPLVVALQSRLDDAFARIAPPAKQSSRVALVLIDDDSLRLYGRWPWPRSLLAQLVMRVADAGANGLGIDILLTEPQSFVTDRTLRRALQRIPRVVLADTISLSPAGPRWIEPIPDLLQANTTSGHSMVVLDRDGVCRRFAPLELSPEGPRWALSVELGRRIQHESTAAFLKSYGVDEDPLKSRVKVAHPVLIPIAFRRDRIPVLSAADVLSDSSQPFLRDRAVLIGFGPVGLGDRVITPLSKGELIPGVEIHAQILDSILTARTLHKSPFWLSPVLGLVLCPGLIVLFRKTRRWQAAAIVSVLCMAVCAVAYGLFVFRSLLVPSSLVLSAILLAPLLTHSADFFMVEHSLATQWGGLHQWLGPPKDSRPAPTVSSDISLALSNLEDLQAELGALYELHHTLLNSMQDAVAIFDGNGKLILKNLHFTSLIGESDLDIPNLRQIGDRLHLRAAPGAGPEVEEEIWLHGTLYSMRTTSLPPTNLSPGGGTALILSSLEIRQERDRARNEALGFVTHELRTPLVAIQQFAELMIRYPNATTCASAPDTIFRESKRLLALIGSYLDLLRLDAGARPISLGKVHLEPLVNEVFDILKPLAEPRRIRLHLQSVAPTFALGDGPLLTGAILNLVSNAIKYGSTDSMIEVCCESIEGAVWLRVSNEGSPANEQELAKFFEPYYRSPAIEGETAGWGLGLAFVKRIVDKHAGSVHAEVRNARTILEIKLQRIPVNIDEGNRV